MQEFLGWSLPIGRVAGITVRVHLVFLAFAFWFLFEGTPDASYVKVRLILLAVLFASVLLHEFGHCIAARAVGGDAEEILLWPLGGLAFLRVPNTPKADFVSTIWGPLVNVIICLLVGGLILWLGYVPPLNPFSPPLQPPDAILEVPKVDPDSSLLLWFSLGFRVNWVLFLFNLTPAFPMDGGRIFRAIFWSATGYIEATRRTIVAARVCCVIFLMVAVYWSNFLMLFVALFVFINSEMERRRVELAGEDSASPYDFSDGYTSLAKSVESMRPRRPGVIQRWRQRMQEARKLKQLRAERDQERRTDELLEKIHRFGIDSLTERERRFLSDVSSKKRSDLRR